MKNKYYYILSILVSMALSILVYINLNKQREVSEENKSKNFHSPLIEEFVYNSEKDRAQFKNISSKKQTFSLLKLYRSSLSSLHLTNLYQADMFASESKIKSAKKFILENENELIMQAGNELLSGNSNIDDLKVIKDRMNNIDFLGQASQSNIMAKKYLLNMLDKPLDFTKNQRLVHMDLIDKLECFEYVSSFDIEKSIDYIFSLTNIKAKQFFIKRFVIGLKISGKSEEDSIKIAYEKFKNIT